MNLLFICSRNRLRSPTAEAVFGRYPGIKALSAGTSPDADNPVCADLIDWADIIFVMEMAHKRKLNKMFGSRLMAKRLVVLGIPDDYDYMDAALVDILKAKISPYIRQHPE